jgi:hypothetical protein
VKRKRFWRGEVTRFGFVSSSIDRRSSLTNLIPYINSYFDVLPALLQILTSFRPSNVRLEHCLAKRGDILPKRKIYVVNLS